MSRPPDRVLISRRGAESRRGRLKARHRQPDCPIGLALPDVLSEVAGRTSPRHSVANARSYSWLRYTVTISISLKS